MRKPVRLTDAILFLFSLHRNYFLGLEYEWKKGRWLRGICQNNFTLKTFIATKRYSIFILVYNNKDFFDS